MKWPLPPDMSKCKKCKPSSVTDVSGRIVKTPSGIKIVWGGQLSGAGESLMSNGY
jgi:hypothetical protein